MAAQNVKFSIDRGGTFTDVYAEFTDGGSTVLKLLSDDPANYPDAPREGIRRILEAEQGFPLPASQLSGERISSIRMGTTVATNALLERKGAQTLLLISKGFHDLLRIGNQSRRELFALNITHPQPLYGQVIEIDERIRPALVADTDTVTGVNDRKYMVVKSPDCTAIIPLLEQAQQQGYTSVAIVLAHGYACPVHEQLLAELVQQCGFAHCSVSHQVMPTVRLVPRGDTTVVNAYLTPHIQNYIDSFCGGFSDQLKNTELLFMASDGGLLEKTTFNGSRALLSGPAGGLVGYARTCSQALPGKAIIGFDMGGTSTDVSRYAGTYEHTQDAVVAGVRIQASQLQIETVAAGGGSRLFFRHGMFEVGPESAGSHPGPVCYRKNGYLTVTDANVVLGRLPAQFFPNIFGDTGDQPLDVAGAQTAFAELTAEVNLWLSDHGRSAMSVEQVAAGFIDVANEVMARPIRAVSVQRGYALEDHVLATFGGAGGQHACAMAQKLGIKTIFIQRHAGILSAYGMGLASRVCERQEAASGELTADTCKYYLSRFEVLTQQACDELSCDCSATTSAVTVERYLNLRYAGSDNALMIVAPTDGDYRNAFIAAHLREFGFALDRPIEVDDVRVRVSYNSDSGSDLSVAASKGVVGNCKDYGKKTATPIAEQRCYLAGSWRVVPVYRLEHLPVSSTIAGGAIIIQQTATIIVEPHCCARINAQGDVVITVNTLNIDTASTLNPVKLALFSHRFMSIAEQMGYTLQRTAISTNIKERCDFSCAIFDAAGDLVANAPHTPVHLGAMSEAVRCQIRHFADDLVAGDVLVCNHPQMGGSHLPDITVITPLWGDDRRGGGQKKQVVMYVANRGHHADIGGITPGSMPPFSHTLNDEGCAIRGMKLVRGGQFQEQQLRQVLCDSRRIDDNLSDLKAQIAANQCGNKLLNELIVDYGLPTVQAYMGYLQDHAESAVRYGLQQLAQQLSPRRGGQDEITVTAQDYLDDGSAICLHLTIGNNGAACFDFSGSAAQHPGNLNAPPAVTMSAVLYCLRCLVADDIPLNQGCMRPVQVILPEGSILAPTATAAVVGGNVLTSQRLVDVIFKAFGNVAASQGCMNNFTFGNASFGYYETIGGGAGAGPTWHGCSGVHTHMTNTRITDVEILENRYPVLVRQFGLRPASGGSGQFNGGDGLVRELEFLQPLQVAILSERRVYQPYGVAGGGDGLCGINELLTATGKTINLGGKNMVAVASGDRIRIQTPGGGGYGRY